MPPTHVSRTNAGLVRSPVRRVPGSTLGDGWRCSTGPRRAMPARVPEGEEGTRLTVPRWAADGYGTRPPLAGQKHAPYGRLA